MSLRRRFIIALAFFAGGLAALFWALTWRIASDAVEDELERRLIWTAGSAAEAGFQATIVENLRPGYEDESAFTSTASNLQRLLFYVDDAFIFRGDELTLLADAGGEGPIGEYLPFLEPYRPEIDEALRGTRGAATDAFEDQGRLYKYAFVQIEQSDAVLGVLARADFLTPLQSLRRTLLLASVGGVALAVMVALVLAGNVVEPLERLSRVAIRIQRGHMEEPVQAERGDELGRLSRAMERMRRGILERDERLRLMLAQVAHEIRNPLGGLELFASAVAEAEEPDERRRLLARVRTEVSALNRIIDDFLAFARPDRPEPEVIDVREPIRRALELVGPELERDGDCLTVELGDEPLLLRGDADQLKRAVINLVRNASQAGSTVRVRAERLGSQIMVAVSDDGSGVKEELRDRVFDPFVTDKEQGAGLGLAIVKKVAEAQGGRVEVSPEPDPRFGKGAEFRLYLIGIEEPAPRD